MYIFQDYSLWIISTVLQKGSLSPKLKLSITGISSATLKVSVKRKDLLILSCWVTCVLSCSAVSNSLQPGGCSPPGSSVHGILQAGILEWVAIPFSRTWVSCIASSFFNVWASREAQSQWKAVPWEELCVCVCVCVCVLG